MKQSYDCVWCGSGRGWLRVSCIYLYAYKHVEEDPLCAKSSRASGTLHVSWTISESRWSASAKNTKKDIEDRISVRMSWLLGEII